MWILKLPLKLLVLPVVLVLGVFNAVGNVLTNLSCYVFGPAMFFLLACVFFYLTQQSWLNVSILTVLGVGCFAVPMLAGMFLCMTENWNQMLMRFLVS